jgi:hypothetical protein
MGWKDLAKLGKDFVDDKKGEAGTSFLEKVLPPDLAKMVTDARPENVATRQEEKRRTDLDARPKAHLTLTVTGEEQGTLAVDLPFERTDVEAESIDPAAPGLMSMPWLKLLLEALDPVPLGSTTLYSLSLAVPDYHATVGHYDLADLYAKGESGQIEAWEVFDLFLSPTLEAGDTMWWWDSSGPGTIDVADSSVSFDLPMVSAVSSIRATGTITWA